MSVIPGIRGKGGQNAGVIFRHTWNRWNIAVIFRHATRPDYNRKSVSVNSGAITIATMAVIGISHCLYNGLSSTYKERLLMASKYPVRLAAVGVTEDTAEDLKTVADILGRPVTALIREAVERFIASYVAD